MTNVILRPNRVSREIDSFFRDFFNRAAFESDSEADFAPRVDIKEDQDKVALMFELPGMEKDEIKVAIKGNVLSVSGERKIESKDESEKFIRSEIRCGSFGRSFTLPKTVDSNTISADYRHGILTVSLAKREESKPKEIEVKVA